MKPDFTELIKQKTDKELTEIFINANDYNPDFVRLAEEELNSRKVNLYGAKQIKASVREVETVEFKNGKPGSPLYIFFCFILCLLGGLLGIYAGYIYSQSKTQNSAGEKFYVYDEQTRHLGKIMMWLGIGVALFLSLQRAFSTK